MSIDRSGRLEPALPSLFEDLADARTPDYLEAAIERASAHSQRPAWTFLERWLPMEYISNRAPATRLPWRQLGVLVLLAIFIAGAVAVYVGSQAQTPLPAPFGPAANGKVLYAEDGDIFVADPVTGDETAIVSGPEADSGPVWSLDGTRIAFERGPGRLFVVDEDGQGLTQVTREALDGLGSWSFSPDGRSITALVGYGDSSIMVVPTDGSGEPKIFDVQATRDDSPPQYSPAGTEILFIGRDPGAASRAVFALDPTSGETRTVLTAPTSRDINGATWSPDGSRISYTMQDPSAPTATIRTHIVSADSSGDHVLDTEPDHIADWGGVWSNDGTRMVIGRIYRNPERFTTAIVPVDRSSAGIELECPPGAPTNDCTADWVWSPDDTMLIGSLGNGAQFIADPQTGKIRPAPWTATGHPAMQRRAP
jgi:dipeptidyl aminopeptidase/acylaminoacyl peptidase